MRLTYKDQYGRWSSDGSKASLQLGNPRENWPSILWGDAVDKLATYEDAEEQGRLVILPCKVGDIVWFCIPERRYFLDPAVYQGIVTQLKSVQRMNQSPLILAIVEYNYDAPWKPGTLERSEMHCSFGEYGDWVRFYLTREEAESALKGE